MLIWTIEQPNGSADRSEQLRQVSGARQVIVVRTYEECVAAIAADGAVDGMVVVGDYANNPPLSRRSDGVAGDSIENVVGLLDTTDVPVLAVGFGFELLCAAFGIDLEKFGERGTGAEKIEPTTEGAKLFQGSDPLCIAATERWLTDEFPKKLQVLARSGTGVEAVKHKLKPLYGLQQCPLDFTYPSDAKLVYGNIFSAFDQYIAKRA